MQEEVYIKHDSFIEFTAIVIGMSQTDLAAAKLNTVLLINMSHADPLYANI